MRSHLKETVYLASPVFAQNLLVSLAGLIEHYRRHTGVYHSYSRFLIDHEFQAREDADDWQKKRLTEMLEHALESVPHYRALQIKSAELESFPILDRGVVARDSKSLLSSRYKEDDLLTIYTGGSTGTPIGVRLTREVRRKTYAFWNRFYRGLGYRLGDRKATFLGRKLQDPDDNRAPFWRYNIVNRQLLFSSFHMTEKNLPAYVDKLNQFKPVLIEGYPLSVFRIAEFIQRKGLSLTFTPSGISTSSENFTAQQRDCIEKSFGCKLFDQYGSAESVVYAGECEHGSKHIAVEYGIVEVLTDEGKIVREGEGELIVTTLLNEAMPLIRYRIGDLGKISYRECPCGRKTQILEELSGKVGAVLVFRGSRVSTAAIAFAFEYLPGISRAQIVQDQPDRVQVKIVAPDGFPEKDEEFMVWEIKKMLGSDLKVDVSLVDDIPPGPNGKYQMVVQNYYED